MNWVFDMLRKSTKLCTYIGNTAKRGPAKSTKVTTTRGGNRRLPLSQLFKAVGVLQITSCYVACVNVSTEHLACAAGCGSTVLSARLTGSSSRNCRYRENTLS
jgi:hypothetical protein